MKKNSSRLNNSSVLSKSTIQKVYSKKHPDSHTASKNKPNPSAGKNTISKPKQAAKEFEKKNSMRTPKKQKLLVQSCSLTKKDAYQNLRFEEMKEMSEMKNRKGIQFNKEETIKKEKYETENERLEMLKEYLNQDADNMSKMKEISNQHIISEMRLTQQNLKRKVSEGYAQTKELVEKHGKEINQMKEAKQKIIEGHENEIKKLCIEIKKENERRLKAEERTKQSEKIIELLTAKLAEKEKQCLRYKQDSSEKQRQNPETISRIQKLETEVSQLEGKVESFQKVKKNLEEELIKHQKEKEFIKKQSQEVLAFIRLEYCKQE